MQIEVLTEKYAEDVLEMMRVFYHSPALYTNGSEEIYFNDIQNCINENPYLKGFVFIENDIVAGYAMLARSFSTEFGKPCIWIEDLYIKPDYRNKGYGTKFFAFIEQKYPDALFRLEVEKENKAAIRLYEKNGFDELPYTELKKLR